MAKDPETAPCLVLMTAPDSEVAARIGRAVVEERLAACLNIVPGIRSIYRWEGRLCDETEVLCMVKTTRARFPALRDRIIALHPYQVPEVVALPITEGALPYLDWLQRAVAGE